jgi:hypothetical protein
VTGSAAAATPTGRAFTGRADGRLAARATIRHGFVKSTMRNVRFIGDFTSKLSGPPMPGDESLGVLESSTWHGRFSATRNRANGKITMKGLILATFDDPSAGRACLRLSYRNARKGKRKFNRRRGASRIAILGGEGGARTLAGSATVRVTALAGGAMRLSGRVKARRGPERGFPAACAKLEKTFGLQPLPNR